MRDILVIDIGGTHLKFAAVSRGEHLDLGRHVPTAALRNEDPVGSLASLVLDACGEMRLRPEAVVSSVPAFLDPDLDYVHSAGNIPEFNGKRLATELSAKVGMPVFLERDSVLLLQGEWAAGAAHGARNLLGIFFGTGVGGAFLQDGMPFRGAGFSMEIGSMPFKGLNRTLEGLRPDCLETYVSGRVLAGIAARHGVAIGEAFAAASRDPALGREIELFVRDMAMAVGTAYALLSPDAVVLGGGICTMEAFPHERLAALVEEVTPVSETGGRLDLRWAELGWKAVAHGALLRVEAETSRSGQSGPRLASVRA